MENSWSDEVEQLLEKIRINSVVLSERHRSNFYEYKSLSKWFDLPIIVISVLSSSFSVGSQSYIEQDIISTITCSISMTVTILSSIKIYLNLALTEPRSAILPPGRWGVGLVVVVLTLPPRKICCCPPGWPGVDFAFLHSNTPFSVLWYTLSRCCVFRYLWSPPVGVLLPAPFPSALCLWPALVSAQNSPRGPPQRGPPRG